MGNGPGRGAPDGCPVRRRERANQAQRPLPTLAVRVGSAGALRVLRRTPARRWGTMDDMSGVAVFLASSASDFVTGTAIPVDGGFSALG